MRLWLWRLGFFSSVGVVACAAAFILTTQLGASSETQALVARALERASHIAQMRRDAQALESAIEAHIRATTELQRDAAAEVMEVALASLQRSRVASAVGADSDTAQAEAWAELERVSVQVARRVAAVTLPEGAVTDAGRAATLADVQPLLARLDALAATLARANADDAHRLQEHLEQRRRRVLEWSALTLGSALLLASALGVGMTRVLRAQHLTIQSQLAQLGERNRELDSFARRVAHELVNPLAPLNGHLTMATRCDGAKGDARLVEHLQQAKAGVGSVAALVDALLEFCRAGSQPPAAPGVLSDVVTSQLLEASQIARSRRIELEREIAPDVVVSCPSGLLHTIAQNLISNALKYGASVPSPRVVVRVARAGGRGVLEVVDNGPGISAAGRKRLFEPFFRAPEALSLPGHGLGLATVKRVVEAHGGALAIDCPPTGGAVARVELPLARVAAAPATGTAAVRA